MNINLFGYGFVGKAHYEILRHGNYINIIDPKFPNLAMPEFEPECAIICVPTPELKTGACDISNVYDCIDKISKDVPILIKSTISLEGWEMLKDTFPEHKITFSPEFLRAESYLEDMQNVSLMYLSEEGSNFWISVFEKVLQCGYLVATPEELILIKYFKNAFLATKVSFFNQIYDMCQATGTNYEAVAQGIAQDERIGFSHITITPQRGWGGMCFPKDTSAILHTANNVDVDLSLIKAAIDYNNKVRKE